MTGPEYKKWMYGPRADRLTSLDDVAQMLLQFGEDLDTRPLTAADAAEIAAGDEGSKNDAMQDSAAPPHPRRVRRGGGRRDLGGGALFDNLPVTRHEHDLTDDQKPCPCCGKVRERIGEESTWQIEYIPGHFERLEHVRFKYACKGCELGVSSDGPQIQRADTPSAVIDKGLAGPGLLGFIVTSNTHPTKFSCKAKAEKRVEEGEAGETPAPRGHENFVGCV